jgi:fatty acid desaturase
MNQYTKDGLLICTSFIWLAFVATVVYFHKDYSVATILYSIIIIFVGSMLPLFFVEWDDE